MKLLQMLFFIIVFFPVHLLANGDFFSPSISTRELLEQLLSDRVNKEQTIPICYNYSCRKKDSIQVSADDIKQIHIIFKSNSNSYIERQAIAESIALFEIIASKQSPVYNDKGKNHQDNNLPGKMDCIDEAFNATHYLQFIDKLGLLKWHSIEAPVYRSPWFMGQHWAAQVREKQTGQFFAVDSWEKDHAFPAVIQKVEQWKVRDTDEN